jgi:hypothetical protein
MPSRPLARSPTRVWFSYGRKKQSGRCRQVRALRSPNLILISFRLAVAQLGTVHNSEVVVIGDAPYDAEAAGKAGLRTIGFRCGGFAEAGLRDAGCFAIYDGPADLLAGYDKSVLAPGRRVS